MEGKLLPPFILVSERGPMALAFSAVDDLKAWEPPGELSSPPRAKEPLQVGGGWAVPIRTGACLLFSSLPGLPFPITRRFFILDCLSTRHHHQCKPRWVRGAVAKLDSTCWLGMTEVASAVFEVNLRDDHSLQPRSGRICHFILFIIVLS